MTTSSYSLRCGRCQHTVERLGYDWRCPEGCRCTMQGCVLDPESKRLVDGRRGSRVLGVEISAEPDGWDSAVARLRGEYDALTAGGTPDHLVARLVLEVERSAHHRG